MTQPTPEEQEQIDFGQVLIARLVGARIVAFGANQDGEVLIEAERDGETTKVIIGKDEDGELAVFEVEQEGA